MIRASSIPHLQSLRASAGEIGGMMGKKFGFGRFRDLPVIRQNDIFGRLSVSLYLSLGIAMSEHRFSDLLNLGLV